MRRIAQVYLTALALTTSTASLAFQPPPAQCLIKEEPIPFTKNYSNADILYLSLTAEYALHRNQPLFALEQYYAASMLTQNAELAKRALEIALQLENNNYAIQMALIFATQEKTNIQAQLIAGTLLLSHDTNAALAFFKQALFLDPPHVYEPIAAIFKKLNIQNQTELKNLLTTLAQELPTNPYAQFLAAQALFQAENLSTAATFNKNTLQTLPSFVPALELKAKLIAAESKNPKKVLSFLNQSLQRYPQLHDLRWFYILTLLEDEQISPAIAQLKLLQKKPAYKNKATLFLAEIYLQTKQNALVQTSLAPLIKDPEYGYIARFILGENAQNTQDFDEALQWYTTVVQGPYHIPAYLQAVNILRQQAAFTDAIDLLHKANPTTIQEQKELLLTEIDILLFLKNYSSAITLLEKELKYNPNDTDYLYALSVVTGQDNQIELSENYLRAVLEQNPEHLEALNALAFVLLQQNKHLPEATALLQHALQLAPDNPVIIDSMGWLKYQTGDLQESLQYLQKAHALTEDADIAAHLGEVLWHLGDKHAAMDIWARAFYMASENEALLQTLKRFQVNLPLLTPTLLAPTLLTPVSSSP